MEYRNVSIDFVYFINLKGGRCSKVMKCADDMKWVNQQIHNREAIKFTGTWLD